MAKAYQEKMSWALHRKWIIRFENVFPIAEGTDSVWNYIMSILDQSNDIFVVKLTQWAFA